MQKFKYEGRDYHNQIIQGEFEAEDLSAVVQYLKSRKIVPLLIKPIKKSINWKFKLNLSLFSSIKPFHVMNFCRQLAALNSVGLPIVESLKRLAKAADIDEMRVIIEQLTNDVNLGMSLSRALKKHPKVFSELITNMAEVGENTGNLSESLKQVAVYLDNSQANHRRLASALRYPIIVVVGIVAAILILSIFVIPKFATIFARFKLELPWTTKAIIALSHFIENYSLLCLVLIVFTTIFIKKILGLPSIRLKWDQYKLKIPIVGTLVRQILIARFAWSFSLILHAGINVLSGLTLISNAMENRYFSERLLAMRQDIEEGHNFTQAATNSKLFTPLIIQMIEVGEERQTISDALNEIARYYDAEIDLQLSRLNESLEPVLLLALSGLVIILAMGIYFPMWDLIKVAQM